MPKPCRSNGSIALRLNMAMRMGMDNASTPNVMLKLMAIAGIVVWTFDEDGIEEMLLIAERLIRSLFGVVMIGAIRGLIS